MTSLRLHAPRLAMSLLAALPVTSSAVEAAAGTRDDPLAALTPAEAAVAADTLQFFARMERVYWERVRQLNGEAASETREFDTDAAHYGVRVARGRVLEKAGELTSVTTGEIKPYLLASRWNRFLEFDVHPATPLVGMLHITLFVHFGTDGSGYIGGWLDEMPAKPMAADLDELRRQTDAVFRKHRIDRRPYRPQGCGEEPVDPARRLRRVPACVGASLYGPPVLVANAPNLAFATELFETLLDGYFATVERHRNERYVAADVRLQDAMRRGWLEDQLFADPLSSKIVPYEVWSLANAPPVVRY